jgi:hypothetical protein
MRDPSFPFQVVVFTQYYSITGSLNLREHRLSDYLNDKRESTIQMRDTSFARLENPAKILEKSDNSIIPKAGIILAFEPIPKGNQQGRAFLKYPKQKYEVFLALDGIEVHGNINVKGPLNLQQAIANLAESFMPITEALVSLEANPAVTFKREAVLINVQRIRFLGEVAAQAPE